MQPRIEYGAGSAPVVGSSPCAPVSISGSVRATPCAADVVAVSRALAGDKPPRYKVQCSGRGQAPALQRAVALAEDKPPRYEVQLLWRGTSPRATKSSCSGGGQAPALRSAVALAGDKPPRYKEQLLRRGTSPRATQSSCSGGGQAPALQSAALTLSLGWPTNCLGSAGL